MPNKSQFKSHKKYLEWYKEYRNKNRKKVRKYNREYNKQYRKNKGYNNENNSKKRYPEKQKARRLLQQAVRDGGVIKMACVICGDEKSQGHHPDYKKPYKVIWLCALHHKALHRHL